MRKRHYFLAFALGFLIFLNCAVMQPKWKSVPLSQEELETIGLLNIQADELKKLKSQPLYKFTPAQIDAYLGYLQSTEPNLRLRVQHLAQKCLGQPYQIYLLGEFPFEIYDPDPLYSIDKSDCVVFAEHIYAMALAYDWKSFFAILQRIRYKNGEIGLATRNHYTEFDWDVNNNWLVQDITAELGGDQTAWETTVVDRAKFLSRWGIGQFIPVEKAKWCYLPYDLLPKVIDQLQPGDFVNIVRGFENSKWVGHVGLITKSEDGTINLLHSTHPRVKQEPLIDLYRNAKKNNEERKRFNDEARIKNQKIMAENERLRAKNQGKKSPKEKPLIAYKPYFYGFKFLRLREDPLWELMKRDGPLAPKLKIGPVF
ncbi:MAG: DUF1460 domain-containing protein [candidate division KSB1 bacterium]|nr:DUF1460 domain-containing protein [candidate division KSB1 bacterium]MDZ7357609.1 DUF1460 domain-containing protein [candidate division KSB1 bacterium]MDZ7400791.1 DUF1460 domain-containing protein [candidate division KSB1 bacterium]